ncbi:MAG TPA: beta-ketoacyl-ACP synthase III [Aquabacterium sp.]|uniref:beta-ketoacyl-ACP synthase III n=1 Tax=Aquabacterium sp. TaxID=1872578 RepID=UPI002E3765A3|nr:beta-ketoacyl-ACP synthase III [Aquabacterium sp.]HEX5356776.1 beta-ketoacyl-ACP synthase III [Aquabacterium sp.]
MSTRHTDDNSRSSSQALTGPRFARIAGTGSQLPPRRVTNQELVDRLAADGIQSSNDWIIERTGIHARHFAEPDVTSSMLGVQAARKALDAAGLQAEDIDLIICATSTPDMVFPSVACLIQRELGIHGCPAFDVQAVCSGFIYALTVADSMIRSGVSRRALVIGAEVFSRLLDFKDRTTCVLFGDGAGAVVLEVSELPGIVSSCLHADGRYVDLLNVPGNVSGGQVLGDVTLKMDGQAVFKLAVNVLDKAAHEVLEAAGRDETCIDWLIPHQANLRIMQGTAKKLKLPYDKIVVTVDQHGNTSAASIPLALDHAVRSGQIQRGQTLMLEGVGGGFTWGAVLVDY